MLGAGQLGVGDGPLRRTPQLLDEQARLVDRDERVVLPVQDEEVRGVLADLQDRGRGLEGLRVLGPGRLQDARGQEQVAQLLGRAQPGAAGEVVDPVVGDRHLHRGVDVLEAGLPLLAVGRERGQCAQVPTGGAAGDGDVVGVAAVCLDVLLDPGDRLLHVDDVGGEGVLGGEAVVDGHADPALGGQVLHQRDALLVLVADGPAAAVDLQQHRGALRRRVGRHVDVEEPASSGPVVVGDVLVDRHAGLAHAEGVDQLAPRHRQLRGRGCGVELLDVVGTEPLHQGLLGAGGHLAALGDEVAQTEGARPRERQAAGVAAGTGRVGQGVGSGGGQHVRRELAGEPAGEERRDAGAEARQRPDGVGGQGGGDGLATQERHATTLDRRGRPG